MSSLQLTTMRRMLGVLTLLGIAYMTEEWHHTLSVWAYGRSSPERWYPYVCAAVAFVSAVPFLFGVMWRFFAGVCCVSLAAMYTIAPTTYHNNLYLLATFLFLFSVFGKSSALATLVRVQLAVVYVGSAIVKATHPLWGATGDAIRWLAFVRVPTLNRGVVNVLLQHLVTHRPVAMLFDAMTIVAELAVPLLLFSPRLRRTGLVVGVALHIFLQAWLFPQLFTFLMLWGYYLFVPCEDRAWAVRGSPSLASVYKRLDWLERTTWTPDTTLSVTSPDGKTWKGVLACSWLTVLSPALLITFAILSLLAPTCRNPLGLPRDVLEEMFLFAWALPWTAVFMVTSRPDTTVITHSTT
jgi:hypothetical protein